VLWAYTIVSLIEDALVDIQLLCRAVGDESTEYCDNSPNKQAMVISQEMDHERHFWQKKRLHALVENQWEALLASDR
jgi:hypothetical protein